MNIRRFFGKNAREALAQVKQALGEDAIIVANRSVNGGTEIMAMLESDVDASASQPTAEQGSEQTRSLLDFVNAKEQPRQATPVPAPRAVQPPAATVSEEANVNESAIMDMLKQHSEQQEHAYQLATQTLEEKMQGMMVEMRQMRSHFETQMSAMTWQHHLQHSPAKSKVLGTLLAANFSASLSRQIAEKMPQHIDVNKAPMWAKEVISRNLHTLDDEDALLDRGGIYALVGPTGVGKTTTTAKLAARYVMKHGTQNLGLITTDSYRIGGYEQLRIYGKILGVMVHAVKDEEDLKIALNELKNKHMILVDTVGVSQRDQAVTEQLSMLSRADSPIQKLLCLNATSTGDTLTDVMRSYKKHDIAGCIVTKLDEAAAIGNVLDVLIRERMRLFYTTSGQRVPEDIEVADKQALVERVLTPHQASLPYQYLDEELPLVISSMMQSASQEQPHV
ncbi:flagellar biosynthesis protein FlhF [Methylophilus sp. DW102]|uniref:flagellar biosynthesis protein FlhF n=1 Tax=Methylophilus sp. DW102 TaxID=3095607 RepID=UPI00308D1B11|nr:flagellar biosynthesis protein FlhF [Methylophilus sp. DW102]